MDILLYNLEWMSLNIFLASIGVLSGGLFLITKAKILRWLIFPLWILFLPNTIYLITDVQHLPDQWLKLTFIYQILLAAQYLILILLGVFTFLLGIYFLDKYFSSSPIKKNKLLIVFLLVIINYLVAFGVGLGRIERIHSHEAIIAPLKVINSTINLFNSPKALITILLFGTFSNLLFFTCRKSIFKSIKK